MGLDIVMLVMDVEERFGVTLPDERAERITTVGELYTFLLGQTRRRAADPCPTGRAFHGLRRTFTGEFGIDRKRVRPAARLRDLFPTPSRAAVWPRLGTALGLPDLPDADPPRRLPSARSFGIALAVGTAVVALLFPVFLFLPEGEPPLLWWLFVWCGVALCVCEFFGIFWLGAYFKPRVIPRVRDLVVRLAARPGDEVAGPGPAAVWADLMALLAKHTGTPARDIRPEHGFDELVRR
jgi:hypothetical protein